MDLVGIDRNGTGREREIGGGGGRGAVHGRARAMSAALMAMGIVGMAVSAGAEDSPARRPGLWQTTNTVEGKTEEASRFCTDTATDAEMAKVKAQLPEGGPCSESNRRRDGDLITYDTSCTIAGEQTTSHVVVTLSGGVVERMETASHFTVAIAGMTDGTTTMAWLGACPAGMRPGDVVFPNGLKMNVVRGGHNGGGGQPAH